MATSQQEARRRLRRKRFPLTICSLTRDSPTFTVLKRCATAAQRGVGGGGGDDTQCAVQRNVAQRLTKSTPMVEMKDSMNSLSAYRSSRLLLPTPASGSNHVGVNRAQPGCGTAYTVSWREKGWVGSCGAPLVGLAWFSGAGTAAIRPPAGLRTRRWRGAVRAGCGTPQARLACELQHQSTRPLPARPTRGTVVHGVLTVPSLRTPAAPGGARIGLWHARHNAPAPALTAVANDDQLEQVIVVALAARHIAWLARSDLSREPGE
jgi:hypothetical protein